MSLDELMDKIEAQKVHIEDREKAKAWLLSMPGKLLITTGQKMTLKETRCTMMRNG